MRPEYNHVLVTKDGVNTGEVTLNSLKAPFSLLSSVCIIKTNRKTLDSAFLKYFFQSPLGSVSTAQSSDGDSDQENHSEKTQDYVLLPPLPEQHRIVAKIEELFSSLDKGIEDLKTAQQQLKVYRQAVLKWAFEGRLTNKNVVDGELPEGWKMSELGELSRKIQIGSFRTQLRQRRLHELDGIPLMNPRLSMGRITKLTRIFDFENRKTDSLPEGHC